MPTAAPPRHGAGQELRDRRAGSSRRHRVSARCFASAPGTERRVRRLSIVGTLSRVFLFFKKKNFFFSFFFLFLIKTVFRSTADSSSEQKSTFLQSLLPKKKKKEFRKGSNIDQ